MSTTLNFGYRLSPCESDAIDTMTAGRADVIVNTCAGTVEAELTVRAAIRRIVRQHLGVPITITGSAATLDGAAWTALPGPADRMRATVAADVQECVLTGAFDVGSLVRVRAATAVGLVA